LNKANQDSYSIQESWFNNESIHMFGIYDGHGEYGDYCSHFAALQTPLYFHKEIEDMGGFGNISDSEIEKKFSNAFISTNIALHNSAIDDRLSGTTAITVFIRGDKLVIANVGDSRAIIASDNNGSLKFSPLSIDQTPFRKDERTRLKKKGAKIMTMDQIEGAEPIHENWGEDGETGNEIGEGDPPRVWDRSLQMPGCAFTRSIGDSVAESIGVFAEPEMLTWEIQQNDKFVIIASDGVFEFLTSQAVVDMVASFADPLTAAKHVVSESYRLWLTYDDRTDDISIIIINFEDIRKKSKLTDSPDSQNEIRKADVNYQKFVKPIRSIRRKDRKKKLIL
jgi:serine/threonine protein phosphatase PrpC